MKEKRYSRCQIYPQLVDDNDFIAAVNLIVEVIGTATANSLTLPAFFRICACRIADAQRQAVANTGEAERANDFANAAMSRLEKLAIAVFAKGLGDEGEQPKPNLSMVA